MKQKAQAKRRAGFVMATKITRFFYKKPLSI
jgi:hypothetical protein